MVNITNAKSLPKLIHGTKVFYVELYKNLPHTFKTWGRFNALLHKANLFYKCYFFIGILIVNSVLMSSLLTRILPLYDSTNSFTIGRPKPLFLF